MGDINIMEIGTVNYVDPDPLDGYSNLVQLRLLNMAICSAESRAEEIHQREKLSDRQSACATLLFSAWSLSAGIRRLVRHDYIYSAEVLMRPLLERVVTSYYLSLSDKGMTIWKDGWPFSKRPKLSVMFDSILNIIEADKTKSESMSSLFRENVAALNSLVHADQEFDRSLTFRSGDFFLDSLPLFGSGDVLVSGRLFKNNKDLVAAKRLLTSAYGATSLSVSIADDMFRVDGGRS